MSEYNTEQLQRMAQSVQDLIARAGQRFYDLLPQRDPDLTWNGHEQDNAKLHSMLARVTQRIDHDISDDYLQQLVDDLDAAISDFEVEENLQRHLNVDTIEEYGEELDRQGRYYDSLEGDDPYNYASSLVVYGNALTMIPELTDTLRNYLDGTLSGHDLRIRRFLVECGCLQFSIISTH